MELHYATLANFSHLHLPRYAYQHASGFDVASTVFTTIHSGETKTIDTGIAFIIPEGYELQVRSRSGMAAKNSLCVLNSPGTIDADYRGELKVILHNAGRAPAHIEKGQYIAQVVLAPVIRADLHEISLTELAHANSERGANGFGSSD